MPYDGLPFIEDSPYEWKPMLLALGTTLLNVTRMKRKLIVSEGGGTRGYASLSMLQFLMDRIKEIETSERPHAKLVERMIDDPDIVANWTPHLSSFGPVLEQLPAAPSLLRKTTQASHKSMRRKKTGEAEEEEDDTLRFAKIKEKKGVFLPCHYFDYVGGTSTGGFVYFLRALLRNPSMWQRGIQVTKG
jgi:hypothetical protein